LSMLKLQGGNTAMLTTSNHCKLISCW